MLNQKIDIMAKKKEQLTSENLIKAFIDAGVEELGKTKNFGLTVGDKTVEIYREERVHMVDDFTKRDMTPEAYVEFIFNLIQTNM